MHDVLQKKFLYAKYKIKNRLKKINTLKRLIHKEVNPYTALNRDNGYVFIQVPRTASTAISRALGESDRRHKKAVWYERYNQQLFEHLYTFSIVRNPWDRIHSAFCFLKNGGANALDNEWATRNISNCSTFEQFVLNLEQESFKERVLSWTHFTPQTRFISDSTGDVKIDYIGKFEHIDAAIQIINEKVHFKNDIQALNKSHKKSYKKVYTNEMIDVVNRVYKKDIEKLDYTFI